MGCRKNTPGHIFTAALIFILNLRFILIVRGYSVVFDQIRFGSNIFSAPGILFHVSHSQRLTDFSALLQIRFHLPLQGGMLRQFIETNVPSYKYPFQKFL